MADKSAPIYTHLPYPDFELSALCLDPFRLPHQRNEAKIILYIVTGRFKKTSWDYHPVTRMWTGYPRALLEYLKMINDQCIRREIESTVYAEAIKDLPDLVNQPIINPKWLGDRVLHASHRSNLLRKDPKWYGQFGWTEPNNIAYYYPQE
jgi:hypothetical protein